MNLKGYIPVFLSIRSAQPVIHLYFKNADDFDS